jgi:hypothetical protein
MWVVNADQFIAARVSSETKAQLRALAARQQVSESGLLKRFVELMLQSCDATVVAPAARAGLQITRATRFMIRLRPDDQMLLKERAAARGMPPATYVAALTRAHLRALSPLPKEELLSLKRTVSELGSVGRNLNQIARAANQGERITSPGREEVKAMLRVCEALRLHVKGLLLANIRSWEQGYADPES